MMAHDGGSLRVLLRDAGDFKLNIYVDGRMRTETRGDFYLHARPGDKAAQRLVQGNEPEKRLVAMLAELGPEIRDDILRLRQDLAGHFAVA